MGDKSAQQGAMEESGFDSETLMIEFRWRVSD